jgi:hypothetical protein
MAGEEDVMHINALFKRPEREGVREKRETPFYGIGYHQKCET